MTRSGDGWDGSAGVVVVLVEEEEEEVDGREYHSCKWCGTPPFREVVLDVVCVRSVILGGKVIREGEKRNKLKEESPKIPTCVASLAYTHHAVLARACASSRDEEHKQITHNRSSLIITVTHSIRLSSSSHLHSLKWKTFCLSSSSWLCHRYPPMQHQALLP